MEPPQPVVVDVVAGEDAGVEGLEDGQALAPGRRAEIEDREPRPVIGQLVQYWALIGCYRWPGPRPCTPRAATAPGAWSPSARGA